MDTKHWLNIGITLSCMVVVCITTSLAYFVANITHNNVNETRFLLILLQILPIIMSMKQDLKQQVLVILIIMEL